ncbi:MAG: hypothetical protein ACO2ZM_09960, partial [Francisellaceae bacterium]
NALKSLPQEAIIKNGEFSGNLVFRHCCDRVRWSNKAIALSIERPQYGRYRAICKTIQDRSRRHKAI